MDNVPKFEDINDQFRNMFDQLEKSFNMEDGDSSNPLFNYADQLFGRKKQTDSSPVKPDQATDSPSEDTEIAHQKPVRKLGDQFKGPTVGNSDENHDPIIIVHMVGGQTSEGSKEPFNPSGDDPSDEDGTMLKESANEPSPPIDVSGDPGIILICSIIKAIYFPCAKIFRRRLAFLFGTSRSSLVDDHSLDVVHRFDVEHSQHDLDLFGDHANSTTTSFVEG